MRRHGFRCARPLSAGEFNGLCLRYLANRSDQIVLTHPDVKDRGLGEPVAEQKNPPISQEETAGSEIVATTNR